MGDRAQRRATFDALINRMRGRRLGNNKQPLQRDAMAPSAASKTAWNATTHADTTGTPESHQTAFRAHKTAAGLHEAAGSTKKVALHTNAMNYHKGSLGLRGQSVDGAAFEHVERSVAAKGAHDPAALAAWIGRRAEGKKKFQAKAAAGRRAT
jgi:hypothetical protein